VSVNGALVLQHQMATVWAAIFVAGLKCALRLAMSSTQGGRRRGCRTMQERIRSVSQACRRPGADERARARAAAPELLPWGTHAYVIGAAQAERMARLADLLVARSAHPVDEMHTTTWQLDGEDIKIDHFLSLVYSNLTVAAERSRRAPTLP